MAYYHGVRTSEVETSLITPVQTENNLPFIVGTAPIHLGNSKNVNEPVLCYQYKEFISEFGESTDYEKYTLNEAAYCEYALFNQSPAVFVNVLDPERHYNEIDIVAGGVTNTPVTLNSAVIEDSLEIASSGTSIVTLNGATDYTLTTDPITSDVTVSLIVGASLPADDLTINYDSDSTAVSVTISQDEFPFIITAPCENLTITAEVPFTNMLNRNTDFTSGFDTDGNYIITIIDDTQIVYDTIQISYRELDPEKVTFDDIIGGYDSVLGKNTGLECIEDVFPKYGLVPSIIIAPKFSANNSVIAVMKAKTEGVNGVWRAIAICDIPTEIVKVYSDAVTYKNSNNLVDKNLIACWPKVAIDGRQYHMSCQLMGLMQSTAAERGDLPFKSPSNENLQCDSLVLADGSEVLISFSQANYLNSQGIYTGLNFVGGFRGFGNYCTSYPASTDVKDTFISVRRIFNFVNNELILTYWQKVDDPLNNNLLEAVTDSCNIWLNGLTAAGALLAGRIEIHEDENPITDLLSGIIKFHLYISPPVPCQQLEFVLEYDVTALNQLFS